MELLVLLVCGGVFFAVLWAGIWLLLLQLVPSQVVMISILSMPAICALLAVFCLVHGQLLGGAIFAVCTLCAAFWVWCVWDRIGFTSQIVKVASATYSKSSSIFAVAVVSVFAQAVWTLVWVLAVLPASGLAWPVLLLSFFWGCQVVANILYVSCSGVMARWYYGLQTEDAVALSTKQACTQSFGSICMGSLLIAIIQTLQALCRAAQDDAEEEGNAVAACLACVAAAILGCIEDAVQVFNAYAFSYVAIYGLSFWDAGCQVFELIESSQAECLIHYSLVDMVSFFGSLSGGLFTCGLTAFLAFRIGLSVDFILGAAILGFFAGLAVMIVVSRMLEAGSITLFVCYSEEPATLNNTDEELVELFNERKSLSAKA